ncbi:MAG: ABC transporter permease [Chloroflexi bacterium]|nr:ABC transporter permease [Chloroflexota bacterium]
MSAYVLRRLLLLIPTLLAVSVLVFVVIRLAPGDIALAMMGEGGSAADQATYQELRKSLGLDLPWQTQYVDWLWKTLHLDFGDSYWTKQPILQEIGKTIPVTLELAIFALLIGLAIALPAGIVSALRRDTLLDHGIRVFTVTGLAAPSFWVGMLILMALVSSFKWMPSVTPVPFFDDPKENVLQFFWPALALGYHVSAIVARMLRSAMLEVLREDYIRTARAKGLQERSVIVVHALKNALIPVITVIGFTVAALLSGVVVIETVFNLPGLGQYLVMAIFRRDYPTVQTVILLIAVVFSLTNLAVDLLYAWLDPRVQY